MNLYDKVWKPRHISGIVQSVNPSIHLCFGCHSAIVEIVDTSMN